ncbi:hypothetical protein PBY51_014721 [Eleginops maclovinus]|uniref:C2H2-type domain-containing protein n=1 Tax=Eleginops maclovinus TaxID=56733 RepID=A0AAN7X5A7_ELEMC|nr:hypothetical protein PBY51_014721 [Eleginops maclovinus]
MDSGDICAATSRGDNKRRVNKKNRDWHKRPHLRNSVVQPPTMQSEDKRGPKKIAEGWEQSTVWPSSKKPPQEAQQGQHRINDNGNTLRFTCSQCRDKSEYVPKDLVKHFKSENGIVSNSSDLAFLTAKNKMTVAQNGCGQTDGPPNCHEQLEEFLQNTLLTEEHQQKMTKASDTDDLSKAITQNPQPKQGEELTPSCAAKTTQSKNTDGNTPVELKGLPPMHQESRHESDKPPDAEVEEGSAVCETGQINSRVAAGTEEEICPGNAHPHTSGSNTDTPHSSSTRPSPVSQPVIAAQGKVPHTDVSHALSSEDSVEGVRVSEAPADLHLDFLSHLSSSEAILTDPIAASGNRWLPKDHERTLKLVAINPSQLVKRPSGDQPVVVLNHPDADIPEATRIMKVINRYRGEVQKVVLSQRTLSALAAAGSDSNAIPDTTRHAENSVQERFVLKLKLRRLSRKKYEVVGAAAPRRDARKEFRCWFCGRVFTCQETWMVHRQRHLMEWKGPKCENS